MLNRNGKLEIKAIENLIKTQNEIIRELKKENKLLKQTIELKK